MNPSIKKITNGEIKMTEEEIAAALANIANSVGCTEAVALAIFTDFTDDKKKCCAKSEYYTTYVLETAKMYLQLLKREAQISTWANER